VGTKCGLFEIKKIGDDFFTYFVDCAEPKACTIVLRGASKGETGGAVPRRGSR
jgi:T-complex protein 1 subunit gamma